MPAYTIDALLKGFQTMFQDDPGAKDELGSFLEEGDLTYPVDTDSGDRLISDIEWELLLEDPMASELFGFGPENEALRERVFQKISQRFADSPEAISQIPTMAEVDEAPMEPTLPEANLPTTDILIDEIRHDRLEIDRTYLVSLCEEQVRNLELINRTEEIAVLLEYVAMLYQELGDQDNAAFAVARAQLYTGCFIDAEQSLKAISSSSPLTPLVRELLPMVTDMAQKEAHLQKIAPAIAALEQMRMRALERLGFEGEQIHDTWYKTESFTEDQKALNQRAMARINKGIDEMIGALVYGKVDTIEEAFSQFHTFTSLRTAQNGNPPWTGKGFRQHLLENLGDVDVQRLIKWSHITDSSERERALLKYTIDLRDTPFTSLRGYPANTVLINLEALRHAGDPEVREKAEALYRNATGKEALTGMSDAAYAGLLREGAKSTVPMVLAMMVAGPVGAYAEGTVAATRLTSAGRIVWSGSNAAGKAGWTARGLGFATEATLFWGGNDAMHAVLLGGGDYLTGKGLVSSFMMLGGLRVLGKSWQVTGGAYLAKVAKSAPHLAYPLKAANQGGALVTEWGGFWGIGQLEEIIGLVPEKETTLREELAEAGISLMQLKIAVAASREVTGDYSHLKTLEIKLDTAEKLFKEALRGGRMSADAVRRGIEQIVQLRFAIEELQGPQVAYAEEQRSASPPKPKKAREGREETIAERVALKPEYRSTREICQDIVEKISRGERVSRKSLRAELLARLEENGQKISSDTAKAIDSMIDITLSARRAGIIDVEGGLTNKQLTDLFALLYVSDSPDVRIDGAELTHVPMVVEGVLGFYEQITGERATVAERKMVFLQALLHDSGKFDTSIRTTEGYTLLASSPLNKTGKDIVVNPGENLQEALTRQGIDPSQVPLTKVPFLAGVLVHHDSQSVRLQISEMVKQGVITSAEGEKMWSAIRVHGFVSSWIVNNSLGELGIKSHVFNDSRYRAFVENYKASCQKLREEKGGITALDLARQYPDEVRKLREQFASVFTPEERAMMLGDHQGQIDIFKYLMILSATPQSKGMNVYEILFLDGGTADPMKNTVEGIMRTHMEEQALLDPKLAMSARPAFESALGWLEEGLPTAILRNAHLSAAHERWAETQGEGADISIGAWLKTIPVYENSQKNPLFVEICSAIEKNFYDFYAPKPETSRPSLFAISSEEPGDEITLPREIGEYPDRVRDSTHFALGESLLFAPEGWAARRVVIDVPAEEASPRVRGQIGPSEKTPSGWPDPTDDGSGKGGTIDPLDAISRTSARQEVRMVSWRDLGILQREIDDLYGKHESLPPEERTEHTLFHFEDGTAVLDKGEADKTGSLILAANGDPAIEERSTREGVEELHTSAHIHNGPPLPSYADLMVFTSRARLNPGLPQSHTVFGYVNGERAFVHLEATFNGENTVYSFKVSNNINSGAYDSLLDLTRRVDADAKAMEQSRLESWATEPLQMLAAELVAHYEGQLDGLAYPETLNGFRAKRMSDADQAKVLEAWFNLWHDYIIIKHPELEIAIGAFERNFFAVNPSTDVKILRRHLRWFQDACEFLSSPMEMDEHQIAQVMEGQYGNPDHFMKGCRIFVELGLNPAEVREMMMDGETQRAGFLALEAEEGGGKIQEIHRMILRQARDPVTGAFLPGEYQEQTRLLLDTAAILDSFGDPAFRDAFLESHLFMICNQGMSLDAKKALLRADLSDPLFIHQGLCSFINRLARTETLKEPARSYLRSLVGRLEGRSGFADQQAADIFIVSQAIGEKAMIRLLQNPNCEGRFLTNLFREAAHAIRANGGRAPEFLNSTLKNIFQSTEIKTGVLDGYLMELELFNLLMSSGGIPTPPVSGPLRPDQLPSGTAYKTRDVVDSKLVGIEYPDPSSGRPLISPLDMDLITKSSPPIEYVEVKRTIKEGDEKQARQRAKIKRASDLGLTKKPGCITSSISSPRFANDLIRERVYEYIIVIARDPSTGKYVVTDVYGTNPRFGQRPVKKGDSFTIPSHSTLDDIPISI